MSATNRAPGRISGDFYGTPRLYVLAVIPELTRYVPEWDRVGRIHDPCSGDGAILAAFMAAGCPAESLSGNEIDPVLRMFCTMETGIVPTLGDYLTGPPPPPHGGPRMIVTNPPYSLALPFAERALAHVTGGVVALFLRLGFAASLERSEFHARNPARILICNPRPSFARFIKRGKSTTTDASEYAWFVWGLPPHLASGGTWGHLDCRAPAVLAQLEASGFPAPSDVNGPPPPTIRDGDPPPFPGAA